ncbi:hypothetical protein Hanom_Chr16g01454601 [Helianthus anomalus]
MIYIPGSNHAGMDTIRGSRVKITHFPSFPAKNHNWLHQNMTRVPNLIHILYI